MGLKSCSRRQFSDAHEGLPDRNLLKKFLYKVVFTN